MSPIEIKGAHRPQGSTPIRPRLASGRSFDGPSSDCLCLGPSGLPMVLSKDSNAGEFVDVNHIESMESPEGLRGANGTNRTGRGDAGATEIQ